MILLVTKNISLNQTDVCSSYVTDLLYLIPCPIMKFTPAYLKNKGQKVRFERKQEKENLKENKDIHLATLKKERLEKRNAIIIIIIFL